MITIESAAFTVPGTGNRNEYQRCSIGSQGREPTGTDRSATPEGARQRPFRFPVPPLKGTGNREPLYLRLCLCGSHTDWPTRHRGFQ